MKENIAFTGMRTVHRGILLLTLAWLTSGVAQVPPGGMSWLSGRNEQFLTVTNYWSDTGVKPGGHITLALVVDIHKPYHINANRTKEDFIPTTIGLETIPAEIRASTPVFPKPHQIEFSLGGNKAKIDVFTGRTVIYIPMGATSAAKPGTVEIPIKITYQACNDKACLPPTSLVHQARLQIVAPSAAVQPLNPEIFAGMKDAHEQVNIAFFGWDFSIEHTAFGLLLLVAAVGGMLMNFTPCVLPLIPIKIMGLSQAAGNRRRCLLLGASLTFGVVAFWLALAILVSSISGFDSTNKLFQYPAFTIGVGITICAMALGMCGFFAVRLPQWIYRVNPSQESVAGSFLFGIMTAVLSTPCTAPFMGAAMAWAAGEQPAITLGTFVAIGAGMALPYLLLSAFPVLVHRMPRTGPASELIKQVMGLLMLAAGMYFLGTGLAGLIARPPDPPTQAYWWGVAFFIAAAGLWLAWRTIQLTPRLGGRILFAGLGVLFVVGAVVGGIRFTRGSPIKWIYYTPERLANAQKQKKVVVLEFTAAWCLNCHTLEQAVLHNQNVVQALNSEPVTPMKVDITGNNSEGNQKLVEVGRRTIPYLVVYSPEGKQVFASDAYTVDQVLKALKEAETPL
jgi:thiol:disulfide interchange protein DsbD